MLLLLDLNIKNNIHSNRVVGNNNGGNGKYQLLPTATAKEAVTVRSREQSRSGQGSSRGPVKGAVPPMPPMPGIRRRAKTKLETRYRGGKPIGRQ